MLPEPEAKLHTLPFPPALKLTNIVTSPPVLTNENFPTIMDDPPLLNDYDPDVKLNKLTPHPDDIPVSIVIDPRDPLDPPAPSDTLISPNPNHHFCHRCPHH